MKWLTGALLLAGLLAVLLVANMQKDPVESAERPDRSIKGGLAPFPSNSPTSGPTSPAPEIPLGSHSSRKSIDLTRADNTYAAVIALREERGPGSFAKASQLIGLCMEAASSANRLRVYGSLDLSADGKAPAASNADGESDRVAAQQAVDARCRDVNANPDLREPLADDKYGVSFQNALKKLELSDAKSRKEALETLADQGQLGAAYRQLAGVDGRPIFFMGKLLQGRSANDFQTAVAINLMMGAEQRANASPDLRYLLSCSRQPSCPENPSDVYLSKLNAQDRDRILALTREIQEAFSNGNVQAFLPQ